MPYVNNVNYIVNYIIYKTHVMCRQSTKSQLKSPSSTASEGANAFFLVFLVAGASANICLSSDELRSISICNAGYESYL